MSSSPFLATRCLQQLADDEASTYPLGSQILKQDFYMDDCLSGSTDTQQALKLQTELINILKEGGFTLRKWCSNDPSLLEAVSPELREMDIPQFL
jgi:hypothetical protein